MKIKNALLAGIVILASCCIPNLSTANDVSFANSFVMMGGRTVVYTPCPDGTPSAQCAPSKIAERDIQASGSSVAYSRKNNRTAIMTAGHFCAAMQEPIPSFLYALTGNTNLVASNLIIVTDYNGRQYVGSIANVDREDDLCIVFIAGHLKPLALGGSPTTGDDVSNIANPLGMAQPRAAPILTGKYCGLYRDDLGYFHSMFTIPAAPGSSGSPVLDAAGHIISVIDNVPEAFQNVSFGPNYAGTKKEYRWAKDNI